MIPRRALLSLALLLPGCGFRPLYAARGNTESPVDAALAAINVGQIGERNGQILRLALLQRLAQGGSPVAPRYNLSVTFSISGTPIAIQPSSGESLRTRMLGAATWTLRADDAAQATMTSGSARVLDGFNQIDSQAFTSDMESEAVQKRMAIAIADQITLQLAAYFNRHLANTASG